MGFVRAAAHASRPKRRVVVQDAALQRLELGRRLEPEFGESALAVPVDLERVRLTTSSVERAHVLSPETLAQRLLGDEGLELSDKRRVSAEGEVRLDPLLERDKAQLFEPVDARPLRARQFDVCEGPSAPERECLTQELSRLFGRQRACFVEKAFETPSIQAAVFDSKKVAIPVCRQQAVASGFLQALAESGDIDVQTVRGTRGRLITPQLIDQALA